MGKPRYCSHPRLTQIYVKKIRQAAHPRNLDNTRLVFRALAIVPNILFHRPVGLF